MKKIRNKRFVTIVLSIAVLLYTGLVVVSCHRYTPADDYTFTNSLSIYKTDSITSTVTMGDRSYIVKGIDFRFDVYVVDGTEMTDTNELDTCCQFICTQVRTMSSEVGIYWYYTFITPNGDSFIKLYNHPRPGTKEQGQIFQTKDRINLIFNKTMIGKIEKI